MYIKNSYIFSVLTIIFISLFTFYPSFKLALLGDDWLAFFRYAQHLGPRSPGTWNHLNYFFTPYGAQDIMMGILQKIFGLSSTWYYFTSYILRLLAAFSLYPLVYYLTKNKLAAFFATLFFSITVIGFDTTNWSSNMTSYITIFLFDFFLYFFLRSRQEKIVKFFSVSAILYYLSYVTTPIRMHGSLPLIFLLELFWVIQERKKSILKRAFIRLIVIILVFLIIRYTGHSQGPTEEITQRFNMGLTSMINLLQQGKNEFIFYPIFMFGSMIIPDFILTSIGVNFIFISLISFLFLLLVCFLIIRFLKKENVSTALFLGLSWSILSFFFAWWWVPTNLFPTAYRYFIVSAVGVSILLATIIAIGKNKAQRVFLFVILSYIVLLHIFSTRLYLNSLLNSHSQEISNKIWSSIPKVAEIGKSKEPLIFYFAGDGTNGNIIHDSITFGFPPHMALIYNLREGDPIPIPMSDWNELVSAVTDGKTLPAYGYPIKPVSLDHTYAFYLQDRDKLINITEVTREKLTQLYLKSTQ